MPRNNVQLDLEVDVGCYSMDVKHGSINLCDLPFTLMNLHEQYSHQQSCWTMMSVEECRGRRRRSEEPLFKEPQSKEPQYKEPQFKKTRCMPGITQTSGSDGGLGPDRLLRIPTILTDLAGVWYIPISIWISVSMGAFLTMLRTSNFNFSRNNLLLSKFLCYLCSRSQRSMIAERL